MSSKFLTKYCRLSTIKLDHCHIQCRYYQTQNVYNKQHYRNYDEFYSQFQWDIPKNFNIGLSCCDNHVKRGNGDKIALYDHTNSRKYTFNDLYLSSNKLCNALQTKCNINIGDRIGILLPQSPECAISHFAAYKTGCIALPLFVLFGEDSLLYRLNDSQCKVLITNKSCLEKILSIKHELTSLQYIIITGDDIKNSDNDKNNVTLLSFNSLLSNASSDFEAINTRSDDPAVIIYTSGTTGNAKGCLNAHRILLGRLPGIEIPQQFNHRENTCFWTPADFAWIGGLFGGLMPSLYYGVPVVCHNRNKFDPEEAFWLMKYFNISTSFLPPTALKVMKQFTDESNDNDKYYHKMLNISSGGEYLGETLHEWGWKHFGCQINEFYSQTECSMVISNASHIFPIKMGSMGKTVPGHIVEIIDDDGNILDNDEIGHIAIKAPNPVMFLKYWNDEERTKDKYITNKDKNISWLKTGDLGKKDEDGYFFYWSRSDDVIISSGYRIGPTEIEDICIQHESISNCAVIGIPDKLRNEIVKLFVVLKNNNISDENELNKLKIEIQEFVKQRVGIHEYPRVIEFVNELPMTISKKIQRQKLRERS